jgi:hypothetical protein
MYLGPNIKIAFAGVLVIAACRYCYLMGIEVESKRDAIDYLQRLDQMGRNIRPTRQPGDDAPDVTSVPDDGSPAAVEAGPVQARAREPATRPMAGSPAAGGPAAPSTIP